MAEGAREHFSENGRGFSMRNADVKARRKEVLSKHPKESRPTILEGIINLKNGVYNWLGMGSNVTLIHPDSLPNTNSRKRHITVEEDGLRRQQARALSEEQTAGQTQPPTAHAQEQGAIKTRPTEPRPELYEWSEEIDGKKGDPMNDASKPGSLTNKE